jgi:hypothetical protein
MFNIGTVCHSGARHLARASDAQLRIGESITTAVRCELRCGPGFAPPRHQWFLIPGSMLRIAPE